MFAVHTFEYYAVGGIALVYVVVWVASYWR